jgi:hypothetical protein
MEDQADRVGLSYLYEAGYDPREAPKVWREITKQVKENSVTNFLYSTHSTARARLKNLNREIAYNYYGTDFGQTLAGTDTYMNAVGSFFGWIKKPVPPQPKQGSSALAQPSTSGGPKSVLPKQNKGKAPVTKKGGKTSRKKKP